MLEYKFAKGSPFSKLDAKVVAAALETLRAKSGGGIRPQQLVEEARNPRSLFHKCIFRLSDLEAAEKYRKSIAGNVLRSIIEVHGDGLEVRLFANVLRKGEREYYPLRAAMKNSDMRKQILDQAVRDMRAFQYKYNTLKELLPVTSAMDKELSKLAPQRSAHRRPN